MDFAQQVRILEAAKGQPALLALATVDLVHHALPEAEVARVKEALLAAAVPHWCDREFLARLLETTRAEAEALMSRLRQLYVIESFVARGEDAVNVHEAARLALREHGASWPSAPRDIWPISPSRMHASSTCSIRLRLTNPEPLNSART
jgi:hypothetical protein